MKRVALLLMVIAMLGAVAVAACARPAPSTSPPSPAAKPPPAATPASPPFPEKTVTWIVPTSPGGGIDNGSRVLLPLMQKYLPGKGTLVIENVSPPVTLKGLTQLNRSKPDGYTIAAARLQGAMVDQLSEQVEWDLRKLTQFGSAFAGYNVLVAKADFPFNTVQELVQAKKRVRFGVIVGSTKLMSAMVAKETGLESTMVTGYSSTGDLILGLLRGDFDLASIADDVIRAYIVDGRVKGLFSLTEERILQNVPSAKETGYQALINLSKLAGSYFVLLGPPGVSKEITGIYGEALRKAVLDEAFVKWVQTAKATPAWKSPEEVTRMAQDTHQFFGQYMEYLKK